MKLITCLLPEACSKGLEKLVDMGMFPSRSAAIRFAVRDLLKKELRRTEKITVKEKLSRKKVRRPIATIVLK